MEVLQSEAQRRDMRGKPQPLRQCPFFGFHARILRPPGFSRKCSKSGGRIGQKRDLNRRTRRQQRGREKGNAKEDSSSVSFSSSMWEPRLLLCEVASPDLRSLWIPITSWLRRLAKRVRYVARAPRRLQRKATQPGIKAGQQAPPASRPFRQEVFPSSSGRADTGCGP